jgi:hypothetical protein
MAELPGSPLAQDSVVDAPRRVIAAAIEIADVYLAQILQLCSDGQVEPGRDDLCRMPRPAQWRTG